MLCTSLAPLGIPTVVCVRTVYVCRVAFIFLYTYSVHLLVYMLYCNFCVVQIFAFFEGRAVNVKLG